MLRSVAETCAVVEMVGGILHNCSCLATVNSAGGLSEQSPARSIVAERVLMQRK